MSGQLGLLDGALVHGGVGAEVTQALANMAGLLEAEGASLSSVVKTTVYLTHISDYGPMNEAYIEAFGDHRPARAAVAVAGLPLSGKVEMEAWANLPQ